MRSLNSGKVIPWHVQLNPTNVCNYKCGFCSCANRDKSLSIPYEELSEMMKLYKQLGMACVTITGGGEPLTYPHLSELLKLLKSLEVEVGLVANGSLLHKLSIADLNRIRWIRISASDELHKQIKIEDWFNSINKAVTKDSTAEFAFSYVVSAVPQFASIKKVIEYANSHNFTHVRIVSDLLDINSVPNMSAVKGGLVDLGVDTSKVIFQGRKTFVKGTTPCYISLLKPVVGADGNLYPCCGTQYALNNDDRNYVKSLSMGNWRDLPSLIEKQQFFCGSKCQRCYYEDYQFIEQIISPLEDTRFV
jgi:MoaA/NifB/PqqE/SkfB family radical SAM enzyme